MQGLSGIVKEVRNTYPQPEFSESSELPDVFSMVSDLFLVDDEHRLILFGEILAGLAVQSTGDHSSFAISMSQLQDSLALGVEYARDPRSLSGIEKVIGRTVASIVESLTWPQRNTLRLWQRLAIDEVSRWPPGRFNDPVEVESMQRILSWVSGS